MPPAFNLSQDQTLQFNSYACLLIHPLTGEPISLKANQYFISSTSCEVLLCVSSYQETSGLNPTLLNPSAHVPTLVGCLKLLKNGLPRTMSQVTRGAHYTEQKMMVKRFIESVIERLLPASACAAQPGKTLQYRRQINSH